MTKRLFFDRKRTRTKILNPKIIKVKYDMVIHQPAHIDLNKDELEKIIAISIQSHLEHGISIKVELKNHVELTKPEE